MANSDIYRQLVWKTDLGPAEKLVALAIAEHADAHGKAWPGNKRIAEMTGLSLRTIGRAILKLGDILEQVNTNSRGRPGSTARFQFRAGNPSESRIKNPSESRITTPEMRHSRQKNATFATRIKITILNLRLNQKKSPSRLTPPLRFLRPARNF